MVKLTKPVLFIFVGMITGLFSQFFYEIFNTFSIVSIIISSLVVFFSYLFLIAGKYNIKRDKIQAGYKAFNGYIFTDKDAEYYNNAICWSKDELHRLFKLIIEPANKKKA